MAQAFNFAHGAVQWLTTDVLNSTKVVTIGFTPKAIRFYWVGLQSNSPTAANSQAVSERRGVGFASSASSRASVGTFSEDNAAAANCGSVYTTTACVITVDGTGTVDGLLDISSFDATGFTLIVDDVAVANITVFYEAWGGDDIQSVTIGAIPEPAATGTVAYTATGFLEGATDQCVMFAGVQSTAASGTGQAQDSGLCVGFATSTASANNVTVCGNSDDASATMDTDGYNYTGECLAMIVIAGGNPNARATLSAFGTDTFTLNWLARATTGRENIYMAVKGGGWQSGSLTINGNTLNATATVSDLPFVPLGVSFIGAMKTVSTVATSTVEDRIGFGTALVDPAARTTFTRNSAGVLDENGTANAEINTSINYAQSLVFPSNAGALQSAYDMVSMGVNNFTTIVDTAGGVASEWQGYLVFGGQKRPRTVSAGHPFIN